MEDLFERWGIRRDPTDREIERVYKQRAQRMHPDKINGEKYAQEAFARLQVEYLYLKDPENRKNLKNELEKNNTKNNNEYKDNEEIEITKNNKFKNNKNTVEDYFVPGSDIFKEIYISLSDICTGMQKDIIFEKALPCYCYRNNQCPHCHGTGQIFIKTKEIIYFNKYLKNNECIVYKNKGNAGTHELGDLIIKIKWKNCYGWKWDDKNNILYKTLYVPYFLQNITKLYFPLPDKEVVFLSNINKKHKEYEINYFSFEDKCGKKKNVVIQIDKSYFFPYFYFKQTILAFIYKLQKSH